MCIQMCKPTGQQGTANEEIESQSDPQQETILSSEPDKSLSGTATTSEQPTIEDEAETPDSESSESSESAPSSN